MTNYCFDTEPVDGIEELCKKMTGKALQSPYRSTVPLLSLVEHSQPQWRSLLASWGAPPDSTVYFEYCVASPKAGGNPSQTDALLMSDSTVWAVEAKGEGLRQSLDWIADNGFMGNRFRPCS